MWVFYGKGHGVLSILRFHCIRYPQILIGIWNSVHSPTSQCLPFTHKKTKKQKTPQFEKYLDYREYLSWVQSLSRVWLFATPWTAVHQASLSTTNSWSPPKPMSIVSVMPSNHLILCHPLILLPSIFPRTRVFSNESVLCISWPKYWSFSFNISPSSEHSGLISLHSKRLSRVFSNTTVQKHQLFAAQLSLYSKSHIDTWLLEKP